MGFYLAILHFKVFVIRSSLSILLPVKKCCTDTGIHFVPVFPWRLIVEQMSRDSSQGSVLAGVKQPGFMKNKQVCRAHYEVLTKTCTDSFGGSDTNQKNKQNKTNKQKTKTKQNKTWKESCGAVPVVDVE